MSGTPRRSARQDGFSLIEFMLSIAILAIVMSGFMSSAATASHIFHHQRHMTQAIALADMVTEELLIMESSDDALDNGIHLRMHERDGRPVTDGTGFYTARWTVSNYTEVPGIRRVDILISWSENGISRTLGWTTYRM